MRLTTDRSRSRSRSNSFGSANAGSSSDDNTITMGESSRTAEPGDLHTLNMSLSLQAMDNAEAAQNQSLASVPLNTTQNEEEDDEEESNFFLGSPEPDPRETAETKSRGYQEEKQEANQSRERAHSPAGTSRISKSMDPKKLDEAVMLAIESSRTHTLVQNLFVIAAVVLVIAGLFVAVIRLYNPFERSPFAEEGIILVYYKEKFENVSNVFEATWLILVVLLVAFRSDFPFNLSILMGIFLYTGFIFGTVVQRNAYTEIGDDFQCVSEE